MRTTVNVDDHLLAAARDRARARGVTLGAVIEDALRREIASELAPPTVRTLVPLLPGRGGLLPGVSIDSNREILELLDGDRPSAEPG